MIGRLRGVVVERSLDGTAVLEVGGVGYDVAVPMGALARLPAAPVEVVLHIHTHVREDAFLLYGFATLEDRAAFRTLLGVTAVGPKLALAILSHLDAPSLAAALAREDRKTLQSIPGLGKKLVDRLLLELKDKLSFAAHSPTLPQSSMPVGVAWSGPLQQVSSMLTSMGFRSIEAERAVALIAKDAGTKPVEVLVREALGALG